MLFLSILETDENLTPEQDYISEFSFNYVEKTCTEKKRANFAVQLNRTLIDANPMKESMKHRYSRFSYQIQNFINFAIDLAKTNENRY